MMNIGNVLGRTSKANSESGQSAVESLSENVPHKAEVEKFNKFYDSLKTYIDKLTELKKNVNKFNIDKNGKIIHGSLMSGSLMSSKTYRNEEIKNKIEKYQKQLQNVEKEKKNFDQTYTEVKNIKIELTSDEKLTDLVDPKNTKAVNEAVQAKLQEQLSDPDALIEIIKSLNDEGKQKVLAALQKAIAIDYTANQLGDGGIIDSNGGIRNSSDGAFVPSLGGGLRTRTRTTRRTNHMPKRRRTRTRSYPRTRRR